MPKYLLQASYTAEGVKGLIKETASGRRAAVKAGIKAAGGKLESMYYSFGKDDVVVIMDPVSYTHLDVYKRQICV